MPKLEPNTTAQQKELIEGIFPEEDRPAIAAKIRELALDLSSRFEAAESWIPEDVEGGRTNKRIVTILKILSRFITGISNDNFADLIIMTKVLHYSLIDKRIDNLELLKKILKNQMNEHKNKADMEDLIAKAQAFAAEVDSYVNNVKLTSNQNVLAMAA